MGDPRLRQFPGRQQPLVARPCLRDPDLHVQPRRLRRINRSQRGAVRDRRQPTGIAVSHQSYRQTRHRPQQIQAVATNGLVGGPVGVSDGARLLPGGCH